MLHSPGAQNASPSTSAKFPNEIQYLINNNDGQPSSSASSQLLFALGDVPPPTPSESTAHTSAACIFDIESLSKQIRSVLPGSPGMTLQEIFSCLDRGIASEKQVRSALKVLLDAKEICSASLLRKGRGRRPQSYFLLTAPPSLSSLIVPDIFESDPSSSAALGTSSSFVRSAALSPQTTPPQGSANLAVRSQVVESSQSPPHRSCEMRKTSLVKTLERIIYDARTASKQLLKSFPKDTFSPINPRTPPELSALYTLFWGTEWLKVAGSLGLWRSAYTVTTMLILAFVERNVLNADLPWSQPSMVIKDPGEALKTFFETGANTEEIKSLLLNEENVNHIVSAHGESLREQLTDTITPYVEDLGYLRVLWTGSRPPPEDWDGMIEKLESVMQHALQLKLSMVGAALDGEFFWPMPGAPFDCKRMGLTSPEIHIGIGVSIAITTSPGFAVSSSVDGRVEKEVLLPAYVNLRREQDAYTLSANGMVPSPSFGRK